MADGGGTAAPSRSLPWVVVRVGNSRIGIPSAVVRELLALPAIARVPGLPSDIPGVMTWRGHVVPVTDLVTRLQLSPAAASSSRRMAVVVDPGDARLRALAVDAVDGVDALEDGAVAPLPEGLETSGEMIREYGRLRRDGSIVLLLDVAEALGVSRASAPHASAEAVPAATEQRTRLVDAPAPPPPTVAVSSPQARPPRKSSAAPRATSSGRESRSPRRRTAS
jgi:chemotaxis signal transduction protein